MTRIGSDILLSTERRSRQGRNGQNEDASETSGLDMVQALASPLLDPLFWPAARVGAASAWWLHVPFAHWIVQATAPSILVELGTHTGVSYSAFCQAVIWGRLGTRCHAVDTWRGDRHSGEYGEDVFEEFRRFHDERFGAVSTLLRCTFDEALGKMADRSIDLLHIDGAHGYEDVRHDYESWLPKLSSRAMVLLHDINERREDFGVWQLWEELRGQHRSFEFLHGHGLGVLCVGEAAPAPVAALCALNAGAAAVVRQRFFRLGERWLHETQERTLAAELGRSAAAAADTTSRAERSAAELAVASGRAEQADMREAATRHRIEEAERQLDAMQQRLRDAEAASASAALRAEETERQLEEAQRQTESAEATAAAAQAAYASAAAALQRPTRTQSSGRRLSAAVASIGGAAGWRAMAAARAVDARMPTAVRRPLHVVLQGSSRIARPVLGRFVRAIHTQRDVSTLMSSPLFDAAFYLAQYPDVAAAGTDPAVHYVRYGAAEGRDPGPAFSTAGYQASNPDVAAAGANPLLHYIRFGQAEGRSGSAPYLDVDDEMAMKGVGSAGIVTRPEPRPLTVVEATARRWAALRPLRSYAVPRGAARLSIVTDSIGPSSLFGGVGTAMVLGTLLANRMGANLRLVTRSERPDASALHATLRANRISLTGSAEAAFAAEAGGQDVPIADNDLFLTTSW
jgi:hypothetical protein